MLLCGLLSGTKQQAGSSLEDQVSQDPSYQRTVRGQTPAEPHKEALTLQGTIGTPSCQLLCHAVHIHSGQPGCLFVTCAACVEPDVRVVLGKQHAKRKRYSRE